jgi:hypothetical protein
MTPLALVLGALLTALCAIREPTADARTPAQIRQAARRAGWARCTLRTGHVLAVVALLLLAEACWITWTAARAAGFVLAVLALNLAQLGTPTSTEVA